MKVIFRRFHLLQRASLFVPATNAKRRPFGDTQGIAMTSVFRILQSSFLSFSLVIASSSIARADVTAAARAYSKGQVAQLEGDYTTAAENFELANSLLPSSGALRSAARMRLEAGSIASAATHAGALLATYPEDRTSLELAESILAETRSKITRYEVRCAPACTLGSNGRALRTEAAEHHLFYLLPGDRSIEAWFSDETRVVRLVVGEAGGTLIFEVSAPEVPKEEVKSESKSVPDDFSKVENSIDIAGSTEARRKRLHPGVFYTGLALTVATGSVAVMFALETNKKKKAFDAEPTRPHFKVGAKMQLRTNIMLGVTAGLGLATLIIAVVGTDWRSRKRKRRALSLTPVGLRGRF